MTFVICCEVHSGDETSTYKANHLLRVIIDPVFVHGNIFIQIN